MNRLVRSASLTGYTELCRGFGVDPFLLLAEAGLPPSCLADPDMKIEIDRATRALELAAARTGAQDFGLRLAEARRLSNLGLVGLLARDQPTLRQALELFGQYLWMLNESLSLHLGEHDEIAVWEVHSTAHSGSPQAMALTIGVMVRGLRSLLGSDWRPEAVLLRSRAPEGPTVAARVLGIAPDHGQPIDGLVLRRSQLDAPLQTADPAMADRLRKALPGLLRERAAAHRPVVEEMVMLLLPTGRCSADRVAAHLGVDRRTLHRWLLAEGTGFRQILQERRMDLARTLLDQGRTVTAVADLTGFASVSAFSHWHLRVFGRSPRTALSNRPRLPAARALA